MHAVVATSPPASALPLRVLVPALVRLRPPRLGAVVHRLDGTSMGTSWSVRVAGPSRLALAPLRAALEAELELVVAQMSHWCEDSDLGRFNRAPAGHRATLPEAFATVMDCALRIACASGGAFDPTLGALVDDWGFGPSGIPTVAGSSVATPPASRDTQGAGTRARWQDLDWQPDTARLRQPGGVQLDLSAIAKGHAVDRLAERLDALGFEGHLVEVGGELRGSGCKPDGQPWWVELESLPEAGLPAGAGHSVDAGLPPAWRACSPRTRIALHGLSVATSGDYRRCRLDAQGRRLSHTLDPRHGRPIDHGLASASVLHASCMEADALATALMVLGPVDGPSWAEAQGLAAQLLWRRPGGGVAEWTSPALQALEG